jgi:ADP-heptose:LPS heptosyltransferase
MYFRLIRLEQAWNRLFIRLLGRLMSGGKAEHPDWDARPHRVLYLRYDKIGDMILSTSLINAIGSSHPTITLDVLASTSNAPVLDGNPNVSSVVLWDKMRPSRYLSVYRQLRRVRYDAVVDSMVLAPSTTALLLMLASGARYRIGVGGRINDYALTVRVPASPATAHYIEQSAVLATAFGVTLDSVDWRPRLYFSAEEINRAEQLWNTDQVDPSSRAKRLLVNVSAGRPWRRWPEERYLQLLRHVQRDFPGLNIRMICTPVDAERAARIAAGSGVPLAPTPGVRDALALVATTDLVVTPDTSISHAASACRKPAVVLNERGNHLIFGPFRTPGRNVESPNNTLATLPIEPVLAAVDELIGTDWVTSGP